MPLEVWNVLEAVWLALPENKTPDIAYYFEMLTDNLIDVLKFRQQENTSLFYFNSHIRIFKSSYIFCTQN